MPPPLDQAVAECLLVLRDVYGVNAAFLDVLRKQIECVYTQGVLDGVERVGKELGLQVNKPHESDQ
jgi:hypothetical protein